MDDVQKTWEKEFPYQFRPRLWYGRMLPPETTVAKGWTSLFYDLCKEIDQLLATKENRERFWWNQVKEKFGILRVYHTFDSDGESPSLYDQIDQVITKYEQLSAHTCSVCGNPGVLRQGGWILTLCDEHAQGKPPFELPNFEFPSSSAVE